MQPTLFQQLLGAPFFTLPDSLRQLHAVRDRARYAGRATVARGRNPLARACAAIAGLPRSAKDVAIAVEFIADAKGETWRRDFGGVPMTSRLRVRDGLLCERMGPLQFRFVLHVNGGAIWWNVARARLFGVLPLPASLFSGVRCREFEGEGRYRFEVQASLPLVGEVIRYEGWLEPG